MTHPDTDAHVRLADLLERSAWLIEDLRLRGLDLLAELGPDDPEVKEIDGLLLEAVVEFMALTAVLEDHLGAP
jgi:hypothetical protein